MGPKQQGPPALMQNFRKSSLLDLDAIVHNDVQLSIGLNSYAFIEMDEILFSGKNPPSRNALVTGQVKMMVNWIMAMSSTS